MTNVCELEGEYDTVVELGGWYVDPLVSLEAVMDEAVDLEGQHDPISELEGGVYGSP